MIRWMTILIELAVVAGLLRAVFHGLRGKASRTVQVIAAILCVCAAFISFSVSSAFTPDRTVTITALHEKNEAAKGCELTLDHIRVNGKNLTDFAPSSGKWTLYEKQYRWFEQGDERLEPGTTESVTFTFSALDEVEFVFWSNQWKGKAAIETVEGSYVVDTYRAEGQAVLFALPALTLGRAVRAVGISVAAFAISLLLVCGFIGLLLFLVRNVVRKFAQKHGGNGPFQKLLKYQFLFEELVKRDFKKKYKRTVLGMAWSVLSPLLTLLVMRLVFTQFFGRTTPHYTIYLFCGNLVFSYFNESTSQGMTSLVSNAGIFTKVNVPKYLFLFSKNVQTLINFGLTLCVFFMFCVIDQITFTWKFACLLYPIVMLMLFNIGVGLILSALFVFFKDIQYLWSVFTMLLMYMSAIFYTIDGYPPMIQNLFLLNPVYLFIRYFRKIVIEATIPTVYFHLLMLADVVIVLGIGCWMYKRYNHKFLYYV